MLSTHIRLQQYLHDSHSILNVRLSTMIICAVRLIYEQYNYGNRQLPNIKYKTKYIMGTKARNNNNNKYYANKKKFAFD